MPGNLEPADYLSGQPFRFRFPFPDEDRQTDRERLAVYGANYERGVVVTAPAGILAGVEHMGARALGASRRCTLWAERLSSVSGGT